MIIFDEVKEDSLLKRIDIVSKEFIEKIESANGGYEFEKFGVGRLVLIGTMPELFGLEPLKKDEYALLRKAIQIKRNEDFADCLNPALNSAFFSAYGCTFSNLNYLRSPETLAKHIPMFSNSRKYSSSFVFPKTEGEFIYELSKRFKLNGLTDLTKGNIKEIKDKTFQVLNSVPYPIRMRHIDKSLIPYFLSPGRGKSVPNKLQNIIFGIKDYASMANKINRKIDLIQNPSLQDLVELSYDPTEYIVTRDDVYSFFIEYYLPEMITKGLDFQAEFQKNVPTKAQMEFRDKKGNKPFVRKVIEKKGNKFVEIEKPKFGGTKFNALGSDLIIIDSARALIVVDTPEEVDRLRRILISSLPFKIDVLEPKSEDRRKKLGKDSSVTISISGPNESNYAEIKIRTNKDLAESEFGSKDVDAHHIYKQNGSKRTVNSILTNENSRGVFSNTLKLFKRKPNEVFFTPNIDLSKLF